jgi:hypothetical protein
MGSRVLDANREYYIDLIKLLKKHNIDPEILGECWKVTIKRKISILANVYVVIDKYTSTIEQNRSLKFFAKRFIKTKYYDKNIVEETKKYIQKLLEPLGITNIDYSYNQRELDRYIEMLNVDFYEISQEPTITKTPVKAPADPDENGVCKICKTVPCECKEIKAGFKEKQHVSIMTKVHKEVSYKHLLQDFNIGPAETKIINDFWNDFENNESFKNKELFYLYIMSLVSNVRLSEMKHKLLINSLGILKLFKDDKISNAVMDKFDSFFGTPIGSKYHLFKSKHDNNKVLKFRFKDLFIKDYLDIKKFSNVDDLIITATKNIEGRIKKVNLSDKIGSLKKYVGIIRSESGKKSYIINDAFYKELQDYLQHVITVNRINNKVILINKLYEMLSGIKKKNIQENIVMFYYE